MRNPAVAGEADAAVDGVQASASPVVPLSSPELPERRAAESGFTRLTSGPAALARLLHANRDPVAAVGSHGPTPRPGVEPATFHQARESGGSVAAAPTAAATDHVAAQPLPALAPPTMEAILDELADRLRFELMREYGTSAT